jgi:hypothetical protein
MNVRAFFAATAATLLSTAAADTCTIAQTTTAYTTLVSILSDSSFSTCSTASGYSMLTATAEPTNAQIIANTDGAQILTSVVHWFTSVTAPPMSDGVYICRRLQTKPLLV